MAEPSFNKLTSAHFHAWQLGVKTGQYYLRSRPARDAIKFTVNIEQLLQATDAGNNEEILKCLSLQQGKDINVLSGAGAANSEEQKREDRYDSITKGSEDEIMMRQRLEQTLG